MSQLFSPSDRRLFVVFAPATENAYIMRFTNMPDLLDELHKHKGTTTQAFVFEGEFYNIANKEGVNYLLGPNNTQLTIRPKDYKIPSLEIAKDGKLV